MNKNRFFCIFTAIIMLLSITTNIFASSNTLLILQAGAALDGAISHSFVELYNAGDEEVDLTGYSLQYSNKEGTEWEKIDLSKTILPKHSFFILGDKGTPVGSQYQIPDGSGDINESFVLSNNQFKIALMSNTTLLDVANPFEAKTASYVDMLGAVNGTSIDGFETEVMPKISKQQTARRVSLVDTDNNAIDFTNIDYRTTAASIGDKYPKNHDYGEWEPIEVEIPTIAGNTDPLAGKLLIFQAGAGKDGAILHSFVELYNNSDAPIVLDDKYSLQYTTGTGTDWKVIKLKGTIPCSTSFLVRGQEGKRTTDTRLEIKDNECDQKEPNFVLSNTDFKIVLIGNQNKLTIENPFDMDGETAADYVDMVGAINGGSLDGYEKSPAEGMSKQKSVRRLSIDDNNDNGIDFGIIDYRLEFAQYKPRSLINGKWEPYPETPTTAGSVDPAAGKLLILQAGAGSDGAVYHSFVELYNNSNAPITLTGKYSLQYNTTGTGTGWKIIKLVGTIPAKSSFLIRGKSGTKTSDTRLVINQYDQDVSNFILSENAFKIAVMGNQNRLTIANPFDMDGTGTKKAVGYVDMVGIGDADAYEEFSIIGTDKQKSVRRKNLIDENNNRFDFETIDYFNDTDFDKYKPKSRYYGEWNPTTGVVSRQVSGLPVIWIETKDGKNITGKEDTDYLPMIFSLTDPNNPSNNISKTEFDGEIKGRGNITWNFPKKPYRIKFNKNTSVFGLPAAKSWVMLAEYNDPMFFANATGLHLGREIFDYQPYTPSYHHVEVYLNGRYDGIYGFTEHRQPDPDPKREGNTPGRPKIDPVTGWMVELSVDQEIQDPRFRTSKYYLPATIKSPDFPGGDYSNSTDNFVVNDWREFTNLMAAADFPDNGYRDLIDVNSFVDFFIVNAIIRNSELGTPKSVFTYKDATTGKICMGPLWDLDMGYICAIKHNYFQEIPGISLLPNGMNSNSATSPFFNRFFEDPVFVEIFMKRWNEKLDDVLNVVKPDGFIDQLEEKIKIAVANDTERWSYPNEPNGYGSTSDIAALGNYPTDFSGELVRMRIWWNERMGLLDSAFNTIQACPKSRTFTAPFGYTEVESKKITLVSNGEVTNLLTAFKNSKFEVINIDYETESDVRLTDISVKPKNSLFRGIHTDTLILSGINQDKSFDFKVALTFEVTFGNQEPLVLNPVAPTYGDPNFTLTTTGGSSNYAVVFEKISGNANISSNGVVEITGVGKVVVTLKKAGDLLYYDYETIDSFYIAKAEPNTNLLNFNLSSMYYDETAKIPAKPTAKSNVIGLGEISLVNNDGTPFSETDAGTYPVYVSIAEGDNYLATDEPIYLGQFTIIARYDVVFDRNGGNSIPTQQIHHGNYAKEPMPAPNRAGYAFDGWYLNDLKFEFTKTPITQNITLIAKWIKIYDVEFNSNGGNSITKQQINDGSFASKPTPAPTKMGYTFAGWYLNEEEFDFNTEIIQNITLNAKWNINSYLISFEANGVILQNSSFEYETMPEFTGSIPTKEQTAQYTFEFIGWSPEITVVSKVQTYTAQFSQTIRSHEIKFVSEQDTIEAKYLEYGTMPTFTTPTKIPNTQFIYEFKGWLPALAEVSKEQIYVAQFTQKLRPYKVHFVSDNDTLEIKDVYYGSKINAIDAPIKEGHTFIAWHHEDIEFDFSKPIMQSITLTAKWEESHFWVYFIMYGFEEMHDSIFAEKGKMITPPLAPEGFVFTKWLMSNGKEFDFNAPITKSITLTCLWKEAPTIITPQSENKYGIFINKNPVSDKAEISVNVEFRHRRGWEQSDHIRNAELIVYDNLGNIVYNVKSNNGEFVWDLKNQNGRIVANGTYLIIAEVQSVNGTTYHYSTKLGVKK